MRPTLNFTAYIIYLPIVLALTWYVAFVLFKNSKVFMLDIFHGRNEIADSTNKLFKTGFYLMNLGFGFVIMRVGYDLLDKQSLLEILSTKIGGFSIYLGFMLFANLYLFFRGKAVSKKKNANSPIASTDIDTLTN